MIRLIPQNFQQRVVDGIENPEVRRGAVWAFESIDEFDAAVILRDHLQDFVSYVENESLPLKDGNSTLRDAITSYLEARGGDELTEEAPNTITSNGVTVVLE